jgi:UBX domain-containing protein 1
MSAPGKKEDEDKKKKKGQQFFAGDGQAVLGPPKGDDDDDDDDEQGDVVSDLFNKARENGAQKSEEFLLNSNRTEAFGGEGRRLGYSAGGASPAVQSLTRKEKTVKIAFYKNGFVVDDGPLRSVEDAAGKAFLEAIHKGFVPPEIADAEPNTNINVALADFSNQDFVQQFKSFAGSGNRASAGAASAAAPAAAVVPTATFEFKDDEPAAKVVLQQLDATRMEVRVNPERHTVADLMGVAASATPNCPAFELLCRDGARPRSLTDATLTLAAAKCVNCMVMMKAK